MNDSRDERALSKILERIDRTMAYCKGRSFEDFEADTMLQEACVFNILQIGELAKQSLSERLVNAHPEIPWRQIYGMRNRIVHGYEGVRLLIVWETITESFPALREALAAIL